MVALAILSTVLMSLAGLVWQMANHSRDAGMAALRTAALESASAMAQTAAWDSLGTLVGCTANTVAQLQYTQCTQLVTVNTRTKEVRVIVVPTNQASLRPDTLVVRRTKPHKASTLHS